MVAIHASIFNFQLAFDQLYDLFRPFPALIFMCCILAGWKSAQAHGIHRFILNPGIQFAFCFSVSIFSDSRFLCTCHDLMMRFNVEHSGVHRMCIVGWWRAHRLMIQDWRCTKICLFSFSHHLALNQNWNKITENLLTSFWINFNFAKLFRIQRVDAVVKCKPILVEGFSF